MFLLEMRSISIKADEEIGNVLKSSPLLKFDTLWWISFEQTCEEFLEDLVKDYPCKFSNVAKFKILLSPDFLPRVSQVII